MFSLREQLKIQFRATQKAQVSERKASDSKRCVCFEVLFLYLYPACMHEG